MCACGCDICLQCLKEPVLKFQFSAIGYMEGVGLQ